MTAEKGNTVLRNIQGWPLVIIILAIIILVGWKRLPDAARSVGRSMRIFKSEVEQMGNTKSDEDIRSAASSDTVDGQSRRNDSPSGNPHRDELPRDGVDREAGHRDDVPRDELARDDRHRDDMHGSDSRHGDDVQHSGTDVERSGTDERSN